MSLKTTNKEARAAVRQYILDHFNPCGYEFSGPCTFENVARFILDTFRSEKYWCLQDVRYYHGSETAAFADWCAGLPSVLDTLYFYNRSAVDDLGAILEETEQEKNRYTEQQAEQLLTSLIYRELQKGERKA